MIAEKKAAVNIHKSLCALCRKCAVNRSKVCNRAQRVKAPKTETHSFNYVSALDVLPQPLAQACRIALMSLFVLMGE